MTNEQIINQWVATSAPSNLALDDFNAALFKHFINARFNGVCSVAVLDQAVQELHPRLHWIAPAEKQNSRSREQLLFEAGIAADTARASARDIAEEKTSIDKKHQDFQDEMKKRFRLAEFLRKLADISSFYEYRGNQISWGKTNDARQRLRAALRLEFPEYADRVPD